MAPKAWPPRQAGQTMRKEASSLNDRPPLPCASAAVLARRIGQTRSPSAEARPEEDGRMAAEEAACRAWEGADAEAGVRKTGAVPACGRESSPRSMSRRA